MTSVGSSYGIAEYTCVSGAEVSLWHNPTSGVYTVVVEGNGSLSGETVTGYNDEVDARKAFAAEVNDDVAGMTQ